MNKTKLFYLLLISIIVVFAGCTVEEDEDGDRDSTSDSSSLTSKDTTIPSSVDCGDTTNDLEGTWKTGCYTTSNEDRDETILVYNGCMVILQINHDSSDDTCATPTSYFKSIYSGMTIGDPTQDVNSVSTVALDAVWEYNLATSMTASEASNFNTACSTTEFATDNVVDILGMSCSEGPSGTINTGDAWLSMYLVDTTGDLYLPVDSTWDANGREHNMADAPSSRIYVKEDFTLSSEAISNGELLDAFKCEKKDNGVEDSIPLAWENVPDSANSLAIIMHHYPNSMDTSSVNSYLLLWAIDTSVAGIAHGGADDGSWYMGANKDGAAVSYTSPCSPSAGTHEYTITLYALSETPSTLPIDSTTDVTYSTLKSAIETVTTIDTAVLTFNDVTE
ncbi:MAG: hypothetical protein GY786_21615 [Proteobacteria bacterium]|nr:hypothetical protein [Pseudomonadota bacterium]